jgi:hypothetical protein
MKLNSSKRGLRAASLCGLPQPTSLYDNRTPNFRQPFDGIGESFALFPACASG